MAFTQQEKYTMLFYLGYSVFEDDGPAVRAINSLDAKDPPAGTIIRPILAMLVDVDQAMSQVIPLTLAIEDGSVKIRAHYAIEQQRRLGKQQVARLSAFIKVAVAYDMFSDTLPRKLDGFYSGDPSENRVDNNGAYTLDSGGQPRKA
jgi:hypothetical protein